MSIFGGGGESHKLKPIPEAAPVTDDERRSGEAEAAFRARRLKRSDLRVEGGVNPPSTGLSTLK